MTTAVEDDFSKLDAQMLAESKEVSESSNRAFLIFILCRTRFFGLCYKFPEITCHKHNIISNILYGI